MGSLLNRTVLGLGKTASLTALKSVVDFAATLALVRILKIPEPWGALAFLIVWLDLFHRLSNFGGYRYLVQRRDLTREDLGTVVTLETASALIWAGVWWFVAPLFFLWLGRDNLVAGAQVLTLWLITERLGLPARAILEREMHFGRSNGALLIGTVTLAVVAVVLALLGWGVMAIFVGKMAQSAVSTVMLWIFAGQVPRPGMSREALRPYLRFGLPLLPADLMQFYYWNAPYVVIGLILKSDAVLGLYYLAFKLPHYMLQMQELVSTVVYPAFTKARDDDQLREGFRLVTKVSAAVALLPVVLVVGAGVGVTVHLLGVDYLSATPALIIFTCLAAFRMTTVHWYAAYLTKGRTGALPLLTGLNAVGVTVGAIVGIQWGLTGVAIGVTVPSVAVILLAINVFLRRVLVVRYWPALRGPLATAAVSGFVCCAPQLLGFDISLARPFWITVALATVTHVALGIVIDRHEIRDLAIRLRAPGMVLK